MLFGLSGEADHEAGSDHDARDFLAQLPAVVTFTVPGPPPAGAACDVGEREYVQPLACDTVTVRPAIVAVPLRAAPVLAAAVTCTEPSPVPPAPFGTDSHDVEVEAFHRQPAGASTTNVTPPPPAATVCCAGETLKEQESPCETVKVSPATVSVPERAGPEWEAALNETVPEPVPWDPAVIVIQLALLAAVQLQPAPAVTPTLPVPPPPGTLAPVEDRP